MSADDALPWTTSRCNRLLRPLSSKLAKLRKELEQPRVTATEQRNASSAFATKGSSVKTTNFTRPAHRPRGFEKATDPDWRPGPKPGPSKKTYGGRGRRTTVGLQRGKLDATQVSRPGEIAMTPFLARSSGHLHSSPLVQTSPLRKFSKNRGPLLASVDEFTAPQLPADLHKLVQGLSEAYANLLQATTTGNEKRWQGTRSLMGACLRNLPAYIELEEHFAELDKLEEDENVEDREVANEIYEHLESQFEHRAGQGWRPFRQVVRAHGTSLLCKAITDGVLGVQHLALLVTHCLNVSAWDEAERLLLAYVPRLEFLSIPINVKANLFDPQKQPYLATFTAFVERTGRHRLMYDLLEHMIALELLPLEWLATECMRSKWDRLVRALSENDVRTTSSAYQFLECAILASTGLPDPRLIEDEAAGSIARRFIPSSRDDLRNALNTTFSSLLTVLTSIALVKRDRSDPAGPSRSGRMSWVLDSMVVSLAMREDAKDEIRLLDPDLEDAQIYAQRALWSIFAVVISRLDYGVVHNSIVQVGISSLLRLVDSVVATYIFKGINVASALGTLPSLISSVAQGVGRIWKEDGFDQMQRLVHALTAASGCRLPHKLWTMKRMALEASMEFAHNTGERRHMAFYQEVESKMRVEGKLVIGHSPEKNQSPASSGGFRWEEGIGEWVTCTPFAKQAVKRRPKQALRPLELLPTPEASGDDTMDNVGLDSEEEDGDLPQSSPIKQQSRSAKGTANEPKRVVSPRVVVTIRESQRVEHESSSIMFFPNLPEDEGQDINQRRSRRPRRKATTMFSESRAQRSRAARIGGLRNVARPSYTETPLVLDIDEEVLSDPSEVDTDASSVSPATTRSTPASRPQSALGKRTRSSAKEITNDEEDIERDELGKTPARSQGGKRRAGGRNASKPRMEWWKVKRSVVNDSEDSEDELSFQ